MNHNEDRKAASLFRLNPRCLMGLSSSAMVLLLTGCCAPAPLQGMSILCGDGAPFTLEKRTSRPAPMDFCAMPAGEKLYFGSRSGEPAAGFPYVIIDIGSGRIQERGVTGVNGDTSFTYGDLCRLGDVVIRPDWDRLGPNEK